MAHRDHATDDGTIYLTVSGSELYGTAVGSADLDEMGIYVESPEFVTGLKSRDVIETRTQPAGVRSGEGDLDRVVYGLRKFARLAGQGNPTVLLLLYVPDHKVLVQTPYSHTIRTNDALFVSKEAGARFLGYLDSQRNQLLGLTGRKHTNRPELVDKYGYDTKFAMHAVRLGIQGVELMETGWINLPMTAHSRELLIDIRTGAYTKDEVDQMITETRMDLVRAIEKTDLPETADWGGINELCHDLYIDRWREMGDI